MHLGRQADVRVLAVHGPLWRVPPSGIVGAAACPHAPDGCHPLSHVTWGRHRCGATGLFMRCQLRLCQQCHACSHTAAHARRVPRACGVRSASAAVAATICRADPQRSHTTPVFIRRIHTRSCACPTASAQPRNAGCFATPDRARRWSVEHGTAQHEPKGGQFCGHAGACAQSAQRGRWQRVRGSGQQLNASMRACHGTQPA